MTSSQASQQHTGGRELAAGLFDDHGRRIPPAGLAAAVHQQSRRYFRCVQPRVVYADMHARFETHLGAIAPLSVEAFASRAEGIVDTLRHDARLHNITKGVGVPFVLPQASSNDIGGELEETYLNAVGHAFHDMFPKYEFRHHQKRSLAGTFSIASGSRHERLVEAIRRDVVVGWYFPCLTGYSIDAAIEQMAGLPENVLLAGGFDTCAAFIGSPDLLVRTDGYPPLLWLAALAGDTLGIGYHFEAYGYNLTFNRRPYLDLAAEYWASGLVVLG